MAALSELLLQMVTDLHAGSHVKPRRVKMCMQIKAGRKGHKKNEHGSARAVIFCFTLASLLLWTKIDLRRNGVHFRDRVKKTTEYGKEVFGR